MNQPIGQWSGPRKMLTLAAGLLPLVLTGAVSSPEAADARAGRGDYAAFAKLSTQAPDELLHDPSASSEAVLAGYRLLPRRPRLVRMEVTAYCPCPKCCGPLAKGITASGRAVSYHAGLFVAADTDLFSLGTRLCVPGYAKGQLVEVIDRGSAIKGNHIDVFFPTHQQAVAWGRKRLMVTVEE